MKKRWTRHFFVMVLSLFALTYFGCKKTEVTQPEITAENKDADLLGKLKAAGFNTSKGLIKSGSGYLIEGDIFMTEEEINNLSRDSKFIVNSNDYKVSDQGGARSKDPISHYRSNNVLTLSSATRTIQVYMGSAFGTYMQDALDDALARYNALDLSLVFSRASSASAADIVISTIYKDPAILSYPKDSTYLMRAGFPSSGNPYRSIYVNTYYYNSSTDRPDAESALAHEIGHAIGFRHSDYMNRAYSCGIVTSDNNEGSGSTGAVHIPGTPTDEAADSWMLACSAYWGRPFTLSDIAALLQMYPRKKNIYVKDARIFLSDDSWYDTYNDYEKISWDITAELYSDAALTIPYTTTNYLLLHVYEETEYSYYEGRVLLPPGTSSYHLGTYTRERNYTYGNLVADNSSGFQIKGAGGYYGPHPWP